MKRVAIIGAGLAGTACAYALNQAGVETVIYEAGDKLAPGASGNEIGLYNPRLSALRSPESEYYSAAFDRALRIFPALSDVEWNPCGSLHLITDAQRGKKFEQAVQSWGWSPEDMRLVDMAQASEIAGVEMQYGALYLPRAGVVSPRKLCAAYAAGSEIHLNTYVKSIQLIEADAVILACGMGIKNFTETENLPLQAARGQITYARATAASAGLKTNLCYGGYFSPVVNGVHTLGATFQRWLDHSDIITEDDADNIAKLAAVAPDLAAGLVVEDHRAAMRTTSKDHFPLVGPVGENLYVSTGHGSHGILSSLMAAEILTAMILQKQASLSAMVIAALQPHRFLV